MNNYKVNITMSLDIDPIENVSIESIEKSLNAVLNDWCDGRYPFYVEQARMGIESCVKSAIYKAVEEREQLKYPGVMVTRGESQTAKWVYSAARAFRKIIYWLDGKVDAKISSAN